VKQAISADSARHKDLLSPLRLESHRVDIWHCSPNSIRRGNIRNYLSTLSRSELARYRRMRSPERRLHFVVGRSLIRHALSRYANVPARTWRLASNEHGRLTVEWPRSCRNIHFSLSHTSGLVALAISPIAEIGIDVENVERPVEVSDVSQLVFTDRELHRISHSGRDEKDVFFELWTLKEAYIKARGRGFSLSPQAFEFADDDGEISLRCGADCDAAPGRWQFNVSQNRNLQLAVAVGSRSVSQIRKLEWAPDSRESVTWRL
jgi:4'-phosphopantetheinyl transferase